MYGLCLSGSHLNIVLHMSLVFQWVLFNLQFRVQFFSFDMTVLLFVFCTVRNTYKRKNTRMQSVRYQAIFAYTHAHTSSLLHFDPELWSNNL